MESLHIFAERVTISAGSFTIFQGRPIISCGKLTISLRIVSGTFLGVSQSALTAVCEIITGALDAAMASREVAVLECATSTSSPSLFISCTSAWEHGNTTVHLVHQCLGTREHCCSSGIISSGITSSGISS